MTYSDISNLISLPELVGLFSKTENIPFFFNSEEEDNYILDKIKRVESLQNAIDMGRLTLVGDFLHLHAAEEKTLYVVFKPIDTKRPAVKGKLQKFESKIVITQVNESQLSSEIVVNAKICRSIMQLAQKNINFGNIRINDHKSKILVLNNLSEVPLLFQIRRQRDSIASFDVKVASQDVMGVILPYRSRVKIIFNIKKQNTFNNFKT